MADLFVARGQQSSLMTGFETSYGTKATLSMTHNYETFSMKSQDAPVALQGARGQEDTAYPGTGGRSVSGSVSLESTADTIGWWLAAGMGAQSAPSTSIVNTTANGAVALNATQGVVASGLNIFPGMKLTWGTSTVTVQSVSGTTVNFTTGIAAAQTSGCTVTCTATSAYLSKFTLGDLRSFTAEINRFNTSGGSFASEDFLGCMVDALAFAFGKGQIKITPNLHAQTFAKQSAPTAATYSTKNPFIFEQQFSPVQWNATIIGTGTESSVISCNTTLTNSLQKDLYSLGNGNLCRKPQRSARTASGSLALDFATTTVRDAFQAAATGGQKPAVQLTVPIAGTDIADANNGVPYALTLVLPKIYLSGWDGGDKSNGPLQQSLSFTAHPSGTGTNDSVTVYYIGTASAAY